MILRLLGVIVLLQLCIVPFSIAAPAGAAVVTGTPERLPDNAQGVVNTTGGNVTQANISDNFRTTRWAGFYGEVSGGIQLGDSSTNVFYAWTVSNFTGSVVYAANDTTTLSNLTTLNHSVLLPAYLLGNDADNYTNTFTLIANFSSTSISVTNASYTTTYQNGSSGTLRTYALYDQTDNALVWAGEATEDVVSFQGGSNTVDYQILVPAEDSAIATYYFYLELP